MVELNDEFLAEVGLAELPEEQRVPFLEHVYANLERRTGEALSAGMTDAQLAEFEGIIDGDIAKVDSWLAECAPDYRLDPLFSRIREGAGLSEDDPALRSEFAAVKWLELTRPDYRGTAIRILEEIKNDIKANREAILGAS